MLSADSSMNTEHRAPIDPQGEFPPMTDRWVDILRGEHPLGLPHRAGRTYPGSQAPTID